MILIDLRGANVDQKVEAYEASQSYTGHEVRDSIIRSLNTWEGINGVVIMEQSDPEITTTTNVANFVSGAREIWKWTSILVDQKVPYVEYRNNNTSIQKPMQLSEQVKAKYFDKPEVKLAAETVAEELNEAVEKYSDWISELNRLQSQVETFLESLDSAYEKKDGKEFNKLIKSFKSFKEDQNAALLELTVDMR